MNESIQDVNPNANEIKNLEAQIASINIADLDPVDNGKVLNSPVVETKQQSAQPVIESVTTQTTETTTVDPIIAELERVKGQTQGKTPAEKMAYKLKLEAQRAKAMGVDINEVLGIKLETTSEEIDEEKPLTRKEIESLLKQNQTTTQSKSAIERAYEIPNESERELHLYYLENEVNPSLPEERKFEAAQNMVNAVKLKTQVTLNNIAPQTRSYSTASSVQVAKNTIDTTKLTPEEEYFYRDAKIRGVNFTKEEIISMRKK